MAEVESAAREIGKRNVLIGAAALAGILLVGWVGRSSGWAPPTPAASPAAPAAEAPAVSTAPVAPPLRVELGNAAAAQPTARMLPVRVALRVRPAGPAPIEGLWRSRNVEVRLFADGQRAASTNKDVHELALPPGTQTVRFEATGYRPVEREAPPPVDGIFDLGDVVFEPDAALRVRIAGAPIECTVLFTAGPRDREPYAQAAARLLAGSTEVTLPVPSAVDLQVTARARPEPSANAWFTAEPQAVRLHSGETATVDLQPAAGVRVVVRVRGPSAPLLQRLSVLLETEPPGLARPNRELPQSPLDASGRATFVVPPARGRAGLLVDHRRQDLVAVDGSGLLVDFAEGAVLDVEPIAPIAGLCVRERGEPVASELSLHSAFEGGKPGARAEQCHLLLRSALQEAPQLWFWTEHSGVLIATPADLQWTGDVAWLDAERGAAMAKLTVLAEIPREQRSLRVLAQPDLGGKVVRIGGNEAPFSSLLPAGGYRLRWSCSEGPGPEIGHVDLVPGADVELRATPPALQEWRVQLPAAQLFFHRTLPPSLRIGGHWAVGAADAFGSLLFQLPEPPRPGMPAAIYMHMQKVMLPARIVSIDASQKTFVVEHDYTAADVAHLESRGFGDGNRSIRLCSEMPDNRLALDLGDHTDLLLAPGSERRGCLIEEVCDGTRQVTCWFAVRHGTQQLLLEPRGHWATVKLTAGVRARILVDGDPGMDPIQVGELLQPGERRVFVADGTRAVHVDLQPGGRRSFAPELDDIAVP